MEETFSNRQFELIQVMRFPLIVMVLFVHSLGFQLFSVTEWSTGAWNLYHLFTEALSHNICIVAVNCFFFFSGYLFYSDPIDFISKFKRRVKSLVLPFFLWNSIAVIAHLVVYYGFSLLNIPVHNDGIKVVNKGPLFWYFTGPADFPLWYVRDLILVLLLSPILYLAFKHFRWWSLYGLCFLYILPIPATIPTISALFFFGAGLWFRMFYPEFLSLFSRYSKPVLIIAGITMAIAVINNDARIHDFLLRIFLPFGIIATINAFAPILDNTNLSQRLKKLAPSVFFIYALHEIYVFPWVHGLLVRILGEGLASQWIQYFSIPIIGGIICYLLFMFFNKCFPRTLSVLCGGRSVE